MLVTSRLFLIYDVIRTHRSYKVEQSESNTDFNCIVLQHSLSVLSQCFHESDRDGNVFVFAFAFALVSQTETETCIFAFALPSFIPFAVLST